MNGSPLEITLIYRNFLSKLDRFADATFDLRLSCVGLTSPQRRNINTDANKARFSCRKRKLGIKYE